MRAQLVAGAVLAAVASAITEQFWSGSTHCNGAASQTYHYSAGACNLGGVVYGCSGGHQCMYVDIYDNFRRGNAALPALLTNDHDPTDDARGRAGKHRRQASATLVAVTAALTASSSSHYPQQLHLPLSSTSRQPTRPRVQRNDTGHCDGQPTTSYAMPCDQCIGGSSSGISVVIRGCGAGDPTVEICGSSDCSANCRPAARGVHSGCYGASNATVNVSLGISIRACGIVTVTDYQDYNSCSGVARDQVQYVADTCLSGMKWTC